MAGHTISYIKFFKNNIFFTKLKFILLSFKKQLILQSPINPFRLIQKYLDNCLLDFDFLTFLWKKLIIDFSLLKFYDKQFQKAVQQEMFLTNSIRPFEHKCICKYSSEW